MASSPGAGTLWFLLLSALWYQAHGALTVTLYPTTCTAPVMVTTGTAWKISCDVQVDTTAGVSPDNLNVYLKTAGTTVPDPLTHSGCTNTFDRSPTTASSQNCTIEVNFGASDITDGQISLKAGIGSGSTNANDTVNNAVTFDAGVLKVAATASPTSGLVAGDTVNVTITLTNPGPATTLSGVKLTLPTGLTAYSGSCDAAYGTGTGIAVTTTTPVDCIAYHTVTIADMDTSSLSLAAAAGVVATDSTTFPAKNPTAVTVALNQVIGITPSISDCGVSTAPAAQATVSCTVTIQNTGTVQVKDMALAAPAMGCTIATGTVLPGANKTCTISTTVPWANFTTPTNLTLSITAQAARVAGTPAVSNAALTGYYTLPSVKSLTISQDGSIVPATVVAVGDVAKGNFSLQNTGTLNISQVTYGATSDTDPRVAAIAIACAQLAQNGTIPAGASLVRCTEQLNFQNVTFIEGGNVVFNLTATADGVPTQPRQVTIVVDNTPSLSLTINISKCAAPSPSNMAGSSVVCTDAVVLNNTGRVRLVVDDIQLMAGITPAPVAITCRHSSVANALAAVNLTAINDTLLPAEKLVCSFTVVTDQAAFEAGYVPFHVAAVGVAAYGTNPSIAGVLNGEVYSNANATLSRTANVTVTSSFIGAVKLDGDVVRYHVEVSNRGNVLLNNVNMASNIDPALSGNFTALADGLSVGEVVMFDSNVTFNNSMIRAGQINISSNVSAQSVVANLSVSSFKTFMPTQCVNNDTVRPTDHKLCLNSTDCGDANLRCDLSSPTNRSVCVNKAIEFKSDVGTCVYTPCRKCQLCLADFSSFITTVIDTSTALVAASMTDPSYVGDQLSAYCLARLSANRSQIACETAVNATRLNVNDGRRAAIICQNLGECVPASIPGSCDVDTATAGFQSLDFCTPRGANTSALVPGVDAAWDPAVTRPGTLSPPAPGPAIFSQLCTQDWHCNSTDVAAGPGAYVCQNAIGTTGPKKVACAAGVDTPTYLGTCAPTPCQACKMCFGFFKDFATMQASVTSATTIAAAFRTTCSSKMNPDSCNGVANMIEASFMGNLGKRPIALCKALNLCGSPLDSTCVVQPNATLTDVSITAANADACTTDGKPYADFGRELTSTATITYAADNATFVNITALTPIGCLVDADCGTNNTCSFASPRMWCQCFSNNGTESCTRIGKCIQSASCDNCAACVAAVGSFVQQQQKVTLAATVAANWMAAAQGPLATFMAAADIASVRDAIAASPNGNLGKRAGSLCTQLQFCVPSYVSSCAQINATTYDVNNTLTASELTSLDLCTAEGWSVVKGGKLPPGVMKDDVTLPENTCRGALDSCTQPDYECAPTIQPGASCVCDPATGADTCTTYSACLKTACRNCTDCLAAMTTHALAQEFNQDLTSVTAAFTGACKAAGFTDQACASATADARFTLNGAKRAGLLCSLLQKCNPAGYSNCILTPDATGNTTDGLVNLCTKRGTSAGGDLTGTSSTGKPTGTCELKTADTDCTAQQFCNMDNARSFFKCAPALGADTASSLGVCRPKPEVLCQQCITDVNTNWITAAQAMSIDQLTDAAGFYQTCIAASPGMARTAAACNRALQGIANSFNANAGRRAGSVCMLLGECVPVNITGKLFTDGTITSAAFSRCTKTGVVGAAAVTGYPTTLDTSTGCRFDSNCTSGSFCKFPTTPTPRCACDEATGRDTCTPFGACTATPCTQCQNCLTAITNNLNVTTTTPSATHAGTKFATGCAALSPAYATCTDFKTSLIDGKTVPSLYFAYRAGATCTALQRCVNLPSACPTPLTVASVLNSNVNLTGTLDMCAREGLSSGAQLPNVLKATDGVPAGRCLVDSDCTTAQQCNLRNQTTYYTCAGGIDAPVMYGLCVAKPTAPTGTPAQICGACLAAVRPLVDTAVNSTPSTANEAAARIADFYTVCNAQGYPLAACDKVVAAAQTSFNGNLAKRAGGLCIRLGQCDPSAGYTVSATSSAAAAAVPASSPAPASNATNSTNATTPASSPAPAAGAVTLSGALDACTVEGIAGGALVSGVFSASDKSPNGTCILDGDCQDGFYCSSDNPRKICRCFNGLDSCDFLSVCRPVQTTAPTPDTRTDCQKCRDCVSIVSAWNGAQSSNDSISIASAFVAQCTSNFTVSDVFKCRDIAAQIAFSYNGNLAKRAGAICSRLGNCSGDAVVAAKCNVTDLATAAPLDQCTVEGYTGGSALIANADAGADNCTSDASCAKGKVCSRASPVRSCTCMGGVDTCQMFGSCVDFCSTQTAGLNAINTKLPTCTGPFYDCGTGLSCVASTRCIQLSCDSTAGITSKPCYGLCMPSERTLVGAKFNNDGRTLTIGLNTLAADTTFPCAVLFDTTTLAKLGSGSQCSVSGQSIAVALSSDASIMPGDTLVLSGTQVVLMDKLSSTLFTTPTTPIVLSTCSSCAAPAVMLTGPQNVPAPCDASTAADVAFDGSATRDGSGRAITSLVWSQTSGATDLVMSAAIDKANLDNSGKGGARLTLPAAKLANIADGAYTLRLTATNFLGVAGFADFTFTKRASGDTPVVSVLGGSQQTFQISQGISIATQLLPTSVCANKKVVWSWTAYDWATGFPASYSFKDLVIPGPVAGVTAGTPVIVGLIASFEGGSVNTAINVTLTPQASPLQAVLNGPSGDVRADRAIILNATRSLDLDDPTNNKEPFAISWACTRADYPTPCFSGTAYGAQVGLSWSIDAGLLSADVAHTFTATVSKSGGRSASATIVLTPRSVPIPTGRLVRVCAGATCPPRHSADVPLSISLVADSGSADAAVTWTSDQLKTINTNDGSPDISIPVAQLPPSGAVTVTATLTKGGQSSKTSITVPVNGKPVCTLSSCLAVTTVSNTFPSATFTASPVGFADDDTTPLNYEFGTMDANNVRTVLAVNPALPFAFTGLPQGTVTLYVCAVDSQGARACKSQSQTVAPAAAGFSVADAITALDVTQLANAGDVSVLASGAQALQSLSQFAGANTAGQSDADKAQVQSAIAAKTGAMISTLATNVANYISDPNTMFQVVSTVATLTKATTTLSTDAKNKMKAVGKAGIAAAKLSPQPITPGGCSRLIAVLATGNGVNAACKLPNGCKAAVKTTRHLLSELTSPKRSLLQSNSTQAAVVFTPVYSADASAVADLLLAGTSPGAGFASGGDNGVYVGVANQPGRSYKALSTAALAVGPVADATGTRADPTVKDNVVITLSDNLVGSCTDSNGNAITDSSCVVPTVAVYATDPAGAIDAAAPTAATVPDGFAAVSGVVTLSVAGASSGALSCSTAGCSASIRFPVMETADVSKLYQCFQVVNGQVSLSADAVATAASRSIDAAAGVAPTFSCNVKQAGSYLVGRYPDPSYKQGAAESVYANETGLVLNQPVYAQFKFEMGATFNFDAFFADSAQVQSFKDGVVSQLAASLKVASSAITITNIYKGSIVVELTVDTTGLAMNQLQDLVGAIKYQADSLFTPAFKATWGITGVTAQITSGPAGAGLPIAAIVGGVVGGVGGAAVVGGVTYWIIRKRRAAGVEPRNNGRLLDGQDV